MIQAAGVLLTPDYNLIQTYFLGSDTILPSVSFDTFKERVAKQKDTLLFSTDRSRNLISLQHTMGNESKQIITLEIIDPDEQFEQRFISFTLASQFLNNIQEKNTQLDIFKNKLRFLPGNTLEKDPELLNRIKLEEENFINFINKNLNRVKAEKKRFYLAYGIGPDFKDWAGPLSCEFTEAKVKYSSEGQRRITLYFIPNLSLAGMPLGMDGEQIPLSLYTGKYTAQATVPIANIEKTKVFDFLSPKEYKFSKLIYGLYAKYLNIIYANKANVIVLLPDINKLCTKLIEGYESKHLPAHNAARARTFRYQAFAFAVISDMLSDFGCTVTTDYRKYDNPIKFRNLIGGTPEQRAEFYSKKAKAPNKIEDSQDRVFAATIAVDIKEFFADCFQPIETLSKTLGQYGRTISLFEENNVRILNIWKRYGLIGDSSIPTVVLADKDLARQFLYGTYEKQDTTPEVVVAYPKAEKSTELYYTKLPVEYQKYPTVFGPAELDHVRFKYDTEAAIDTADKRDATYYLTEEDLTKFSNQGMINELKIVTKSEFRYLYGELEDSGFKSIDSKLEELRIGIRKSKENIPIFRYNVKNPNVEKLELDSKSFYGIVLQSAVHRQITDFGTRFVKKDLNLDILDQRTRNIYKHANEIKNVFYSNGKKSNYSDLQKIALKYVQSDSSLNSTEPTALSQFIALLVIQLATTNSGEVSPIIQLDTNTESELVNLCKIYFDLMSQVFVLKIRTLPYFKLSNFFDVNLREVFLVAATPNAYGTKQSQMDRFLTNKYNLVAFTHVITDTEAYSEFSMIINPGESVTEKTVGEKTN